jgi:DnaJ-class molecular chaperone
MTDYYEILEIQRTATKDEIKQSYKRLAKIHHPDKGGDKEVFQKIQTAYETLSDEQKRQQYDNPMPQFHGMPDIFGNGGGFFPGNPVNLDFLFRNNMKKNINHNHSINITLYDVHFGLKKTLNIKHEVKCENCNKKCESCKGAGRKKQFMSIGPMQIIQEQPCSDCNAHGIVKNNISCSLCDNKGFTIKENIITIVIPKGVENGKQFVFKGLGEQAKHENEMSGDLIITVQIDDGILFKRNGLDLIYEVNISFKESIIGKEIAIPHFEKEFMININNFGIIDPTKHYIINNKGLRNESNVYGNLYIKFSIDYNYKLDEKKLQKLKEIL